MEFLNTPISSPILIVLTILFGITSAITVFDKRLIQAAKQQELPADEPMLPQWVSFVHGIYIFLCIAIALLNWKYFIVVYIIKFVLSVLPVLETIGNMMMAPFKKN